MASGCIWSEKDIEYLCDNWGDKPVPQIAKKLGRTVNAIVLKAKRMNLGNQMDSGSMINARRASYLLGIDVHTITDYWIPQYGLKAKKKNIRYDKFQTIIKFDDLITWLKNNQNKWDSRKVEQYALGCEFDWLKEKRKSDYHLPKRKAQKWTKEEDMHLVTMLRRGRTYAEIGQRLERSPCAVGHRIARIDVWGTGGNNVHNT